MIFSFINLPGVPEEVKTVFDTYMGYIFDNLDFISFFVNVSTLKTVALIAIALYAFEHIFKIMMWIIHKIPLSIQ